MNILEYYQYEAERCDNGEMVRGYYTREHFFGATFGDFIYRDRVDTSLGLKGIIWLDGEKCRVKRESVRRVAVEPIEEYNDYEKRNTYKCPNCKRRIIPESHFCQWRNCGMAIDWNEI